MLETQASNVGAVLSESLLLSNYKQTDFSDKLQKIKTQLNELPTVLDKDTLTKLKNGGYDISLKEYTNMSSYNTVMGTLYGNSSANKFQNLLNTITNASENSLATAKSFVEKMRENGMSNKAALRTYSALQKYTAFSTLNNYNYVSAKI